MSSEVHVTDTRNSADRFRSFSSADFLLPEGKEENWRFTPMESLKEVLSSSAVFSHPSEEVEGVDITVVSSGDDRIGKAGAPDDILGAIAWEKAQSRNLLKITSDQCEDTFVRVDLEKGLYAHHLCVDVQERASGTVVMTYGGDATLANTVEILVGEAAELTIVSIHNGKPDMKMMSSHRIKAAKNAVVRYVCITLDGGFVRVNTAVEFEGSGADVTLLGAYITNEHQHHEHRLFVNHQEPDCTSLVTYKGALQGDNAHAVWVGDVLIGSQATQTKTYELNRNLVLSEGPRVDSIPNLEIETGKIQGAGHASATGRFDDEMLFYLQSRGLTEENARKLVVRGFFAEMIEHIGVPAVQEKLMGIIEEKLNLHAENNEVIGGE
ncbi:MAG: Fe-S cluster assembly protein SufD [Actinomycetaceae bacterium]|nr:Fe-S cluster assembly protein SufD [Actinomycetaceae bacterium]